MLPHRLLQKCNDRMPSEGDLTKSPVDRVRSPNRKHQQHDSFQPAGAMNLFESLIAAECANEIGPYKGGAIPRCVDYPSKLSRSLAFLSTRVRVAQLSRPEVDFGNPGLIRRYLRPLSKTSTLEVLGHKLLRMPHEGKGGLTCVAKTSRWQP